MNEEISENVRKKSRYIITDFDLSALGYYRSGKRKGITQWVLKEFQNELTSRYEKAHPENRRKRQQTYYKRHSEEIKKRHKQHRDDNLEEERERERRWKRNHPEQCRESCRRWESQHREERKRYNKKWYENNPEKVKAYKQKFYQNHRDSCLEKQKIYAETHQMEIVEYRNEYYQMNKEEIIEKVCAYIQTPAGRLCARKRTAKHKQKGFIPLNHPLTIEFDWHHIHKELPFVMAIPRSLHRQRLGKKHCDAANKLTRLDIFVDKNFDITPKDYVENVVELFFPERFRQYWIGDYYGGGDSVLVIT